MELDLRPSLPRHCTVKRIENTALLFFGDVESPKDTTNLFLGIFSNPPMRCNYSFQTTDRGWRNYQEGEPTSLGFQVEEESQIGE